MGARLPNPYLVKLNRSYTIDEARRVLKVSRNTVGNWIKDGLRVCDDRRPTLILGGDLFEYLTNRRQKRRCSCASGQLYCFHCRAAREPALGIADYNPLTPTTGDLIALCSVCETLMYRRVNRARLDQVRGNVEVNVRSICNT